MKNFWLAGFVAFNILLSAEGFSQSGIDSLYNVLEDMDQQDTNKVRLQLRIARLELFSRPENARTLALEALKLSDQLNYDKGRGISHTYLASYYRSQGDLDKTAAHAMEMLTIYERLQDYPGLARTYALLGLTHQQWKSYDQANTYLQKALSVNLQVNNRIGIGHAYNNLGVLHALTGNDEKALEYFGKSLEFSIELGDTIGVIGDYVNIGKLSLNTDHEKAIDYFEKAERIISKVTASVRHQSDNTIDENLSVLYNGMATAHQKRRNFDAALVYGLKALELAKRNRYKTRILAACKTLSKIQAERGRYQEALAYANLATVYQDSVFSEEKLRQLAELEAKYESDKKEQTIELLAKDNRIKSLSRNLLIAAISFIVVISGLIYFFQRQRNRKNQRLLTIQRELNQHLIEMDQVKSRFFANISHEFRTPLTLILGPVEDKLMNGKLSEKDRISFQTIRRSATRLLELINQLLDFSKVESGYTKLNTESGSLQDFLLTIFASFDPLAELHHVRYHKNVSIPERVVLFDRDKLEKIVTNLISNAFKFTPRESLIEITAVATENDDGISTALLFEVRNDGSVIPDAIHSKIFDPFYQGPVENTAVAGSGLGLALVKELVKLHGGTVEVESNEGTGTVFRVRLMFRNSVKPVVVLLDKTTEKSGVDESLPVPTPDPPDSERDHILVIEDNAEVNNYVATVLGKHFSITQASDGEEGYRDALQSVPNLIVADVMMPRMSGIDLCHQIKRNSKTSHIPVILLTARADQESKLEGLRTGADDYLIKPFNSEELLARVNNLLEQRKRLARQYDARVIVQPHEIAVTSLDEKFIMKIISVIEANLEGNIDLDLLTSEVGMSRTNLHRKLKAITGYSATEFIQDFRLRRAAQLIEKKADTLAQISFQVGFSDQSYFTKCFKKKFGKTPSEYLNQSR